MYLIKASKNKKYVTAHLWNEDSEDTWCRMYSTHGLFPENYIKTEDLTGKLLCKNCLGHKPDLPL